MSYAMTHLIIANEFAKHKNLKEKDIFLLGSISPDAVHARENFSLEMKAKSHYMQDDERWGEIYKEEAMIIWYHRLENIYKENARLATNEKELAFLQGYVVHMLTDVFNCALLYAPNLIKHDFKVDSFRVAYREDCICQDAWLYQNYEESKLVMEALERAIKNDLSDEMIAHLGLSKHISAKNVIDNTNFQAKLFRDAEFASLDNLKMVTKEGTQYFLDRVLSECERLLFDFPDCGRTFEVKL